MKAKVAAGALVLALSSMNALAAPGDADEGKRAFATGVNLVQDPDGAKYDEALPLFRKAYKLLGNWKVLGNVGLCAMKIERDGEAIEAYQKYLAEGGAQIDKAERAQVERDLSTLQGQVVKVHLDLPGSGLKIVDERSNARGARFLNEYDAPASAIDLGLHPGHHSIVVHTLGGDLHWDPELAPGSTASHRFESSAPSSKVAEQAPPSHAALARAEPSEPHRSQGLSPLGYVGFSVAGVGLITGTVSGILSLSHASSAKQYCTGSACTAQAGDDIDSSKSLAVISNISFGVGLAGAAVGLIALFTGHDERSAESAPMLHHGDLRITPVASPRSLGLRGEF